MKVIGLTGGIASGKSTVSEYLLEKGAFIIDADLLARQIVQPGEPAWREIRDYFGEDVILFDGQLDRVALGRKVFADKEALQVLNSFTHPRVIQRTQELLDDIRSRDPDAIAVVEAPLLIEAGMLPLVDEVWLVAVELPTQLQRLVQRDKLSLEEARQRIASQMPLEEKKLFAQRIISNDEQVEETKRQVDEFWEQLRAAL